MSAGEYEDDELHNWRTFILGVVAISLAIILGVSFYNTYTTASAVKAGLCQGTLQGAAGTHWVKCGP